MTARCPPIDHHFPGLDCPCVEMDNQDAAYQAVKYLIELGHRRIAHITSDHTARRRISSIKDREAGYLRALTQASIPVREDYIIHSDILNIDEQPTPQVLRMMSYAPMHRLLSRPEPPTAVFLINDMFAPGAYEAITTGGLKVPADISLISIGPESAAHVIPTPLTMTTPPRTQHRPNRR